MPDARKRVRLDAATLRHAAGIADARAKLWEPTKACTLRVYEMREDHQSEARYIAGELRALAAREARRGK